MSLDRAKLTKMMGLTTSDQDGEALAAIRMVNAMLAKEKVTWGEVLAAGGPTVTVTVTRNAPPSSYHESEPTDWVAPHLRDKVTIDLMFRAIFSQPRTGNEDFWQWCDGVHNHFNQHGQLTAGQYAAVRKCYGRALRANGRG